MEKIIEIKWDELWAMMNILNEVCNGIQIYDLEKKLGFNRTSIKDLMNKIAVFKIYKDEPEEKISFVLNDFEINVIKICFKEVLKEIEEWEFQTRIGVTIEEAKAIKSMWVD